LDWGFYAGKGHFARRQAGRLATSLSQNIFDTLGLA